MKVALLLTFGVCVYGLCDLKLGKCDDLEMFNQCNNVQIALTNYCNRIIDLNATYSLIGKIPQLQCEHHITCYGARNVDAYCQNMVSYQICQSGGEVLQQFIDEALKVTTIPQELLNNKPKFTCLKENRDSINGYLVKDYYESGTDRLLPSLLVLILVGMFWI